MCSAKVDTTSRLISDSRVIDNVVAILDGQRQREHPRKMHDQMPMPMAERRPRSSHAGGRPPAWATRMAQDERERV